MLGKIIKNKIKTYIRNIITEDNQPDTTTKAEKKRISKYSEDISSIELKKEKAIKMLNLSFQKTIKDFKVNIGNKKMAMDEYKDFVQPTITSGVAKDIVYTFFSKFGFIGWQQCALLAQHWLISNACSIPPKDAIRNGWQNTFVDKDIKEQTKEKDKEQKFLVELNEITNTKFKLSAKAIQWVTKYNIYGIGIALSKVDGIDYEKPFNIDGVKKGSFKGIAVIDPYWLTPEFDETAMTDPSAPNFYTPTHYRMANGSKEGQKIHSSHFVIIRRKEVPDILKPSYYFGGIPLTQEIFERVYASEKSANEQPLLLLTKRLNTWKINFEEYFADPEKYKERINVFTEKRDNQGVLLIDHEDDLGQTNTNLSDLDQVVMSQYKLVAAVARIPVDKLFELNPSGALSNNGDYNIKNYNQDLATMQTDLFRPLIDRVNELTMRSYYDRKEKIAITFNPTDNPTDKERAESIRTEVDTLQNLINTNIITTEEARQKLVSDKDNGFGFLDEEMPEQEQDNTDIEQMLAQAQQGGKGQQQQAQSKDSAVQDTDWITVHTHGNKEAKGQPVPVEEGQTKGEAIKQHFQIASAGETDLKASLSEQIKKKISDLEEQRVYENKYGQTIDLDKSLRVFKKEAEKYAVEERKSYLLDLLDNDKDKFIDEFGKSNIQEMLDDYNSDNEEQIESVQEALNNDDIRADIKNVIEDTAGYEIENSEQYHNLLRKYGNYIDNRINVLADILKEKGYKVKIDKSNMSESNYIYLPE